MATTGGTTDRHYCRPFSRGTLLVLVMSCLIIGAHWFVYSSIELRVAGTCTGLYSLWSLGVTACDRLGG